MDALDFRQRTCDEQRSWDKPPNISMTERRESREHLGPPREPPRQPLPHQPHHGHQPLPLDKRSSIWATERSRRSALAHVALAAHTIVGPTSRWTTPPAAERSSSSAPADAPIVNGTIVRHISALTRKHSSLRRRPRAAQSGAARSGAGDSDHAVHATWLGIRPTARPRCQARPKASRRHRRAAGRCVSLPDVRAARGRSEAP